jgi:uncharacterized membrane protein YfcA
MELIFLSTLLIVAFLYSSVGHGGASGYLALMALFGISPVFMKSSALILNLFVAGLAFISFYRGGFFKWKILFPFVISSMPMAFWGARVNIDPETYKIILGICLLIAVLRIMVHSNKDPNTSSPPFILSFLIGAFLGFFSGMIGIGGGIILSPLLLLTNWCSVKETAAVSALFIFLNSISGLLGLWHAGISINPQIFLWVSIAIIGGFWGSYSGSFKLNTIQLRYILAGVLLVASFKLFLV